MEHFALDILLKKEGETYVLSQAARELSEKYDEVLLDEYQDSNLVQEILMQTVSGWVNERKNIFMVGDVKQSIYRFRLARPELFMEKYKSYSLEDSPEQRIDLHKISEADRKSLKVSTLFSGRSWGKIWEELLTTRRQLCIPELLFRKARIRNL
ncbi:MAG: UvrD-helicase domain-containing protein [Blautia massiliensis (ex Durand et al. 2017)]